MAKCKSCNAEIVWITTENGKKMPCNAVQVIYWQKDRANGKAVTQTYSLRMAGLSIKRLAVLIMNFQSVYDKVMSADATRQEVEYAVDYALHKYGADYPAFDVVVKEIIQQRRFSQATFEFCKRKEELSCP